MLTVARRSKIANGQRGENERLVACARVCMRSGMRLVRETADGAASELARCSVGECLGSSYPGGADGVENTFARFVRLTVGGLSRWQRHVIGPFGQGRTFPLADASYRLCSSAWQCFSGFVPFAAHAYAFGNNTPFACLLTKIRPFAFVDLSPLELVVVVVVVVVLAEGSC